MPSMRRKHQIETSKNNSLYDKGKTCPKTKQQKTFGKALGVAKQLATMKAKFITSERYPCYPVSVHDSESAQPILL